jgi:SAM-dependent methyltransferase
MDKRNLSPDVVSPQTIASGQHYYSDGQSLRAKHQLAGNQFVKWALGLIPSRTLSMILDAGGGWGRYTWQLIHDRHIDPRKMMLTDLSEGMLKTAAEEGVPIRMSVCNIDALPFRDRQFDLVMANHVLYHLQDIPAGVKELARMVRADGCLLATTNSDKITAAIIALHYQALEKLGVPFIPEPPSSFSMENGGALLAAQFRRVEQHYYEDEDLIYEAAEIRRLYETIGRYRNLLPRDDIPENVKRALPQVVEQLAQEIIAREGVLRSPTLMGAFVCTEPLAAGGFNL